MSQGEGDPKFIIIRRDNIGDLVCTTPLFRALRARFPHARIAALVNSYNVPVLEDNPDIDEVYAYTKAKHRTAGETVFGVYLDRLLLFSKLRRNRFDYAILAGANFLPRALRLARMIAPRHIIGFTEPGNREAQDIDLGIPYALDRPMHEAEDIFRLLAPLGIHGRPPKLRLTARPAEIAEAKRLLKGTVPEQAPRPLLIGVHISSRKPSQRWPAENFAGLIRRLHQIHAATFMLFWSPGDDSNPHHPGDDAKAQQIMAALPDLPVLAYPTHQLRQLIGGLSLCDAVVCSDGGAMHLAAGLDKPILCFFGNSDRTRWYPWGVPHVLLQPPSREVSDITVDEAAAGFERLLAKPASPPEIGASRSPAAAAAD
jgi:ADP-heptose:LPS heptosyltransferase